jgi:AIG2-like family
VDAAYGSNLQVAQMRLRCPGAVMAGHGVIEGYRLVFRGTADIEPCAQARVPVGLWLLPPADERALDRHEGVEFGAYERVRLQALTSHGMVEALVYRMLRRDFAPPKPAYLARITEGYGDFGLASEILREAVNWSTARAAA